jgi:diaminopimelate decarboxylase
MIRASNKGHSLASRLGRDVLDRLHEEHGPSFHLLDQERAKKNFRDLLDRFSTIYPRTSIGHSYKTNYIPALCRATHAWGAYAEVVSGMEYDLAIRLRVPPERILLNGPIKSPALLERALEAGALVNVDSLQEASVVAKIATRLRGKELRVGLRCNFSIPGLARSRFGLDFENGNLEQAAAVLRTADNVKIEGLHGHFGGDRSVSSYRYRTEKMISIADEIFNHKPPLWLDIGGGFAGHMPAELAEQFPSPLPSYSDYAKAVAGAMKSRYGTGSDSPALIVEPGMALFSDVMEFVCRVYTSKRIEQKEHAIVHGSIYNVKPLSNKFDLPVEVIPCDRPLSESRTWIIGGLTCMEIDILHSGLEADIGIGDDLAFCNTGAYTVVLKPPFIETAPAIIGFDGERLTLVRRAETLEDILVTYDPENSGYL